MVSGPTLARSTLISLFFCAMLPGQVTISGRVVDETGAGVAGALVELRTAAGEPPVTASSDPAGSFALTLTAAGEYQIRCERQGFYLFQGRGQHFDTGLSQLTITLNHEREFSERVDVTYSPPAIDPQQPSDHKQLDNAEIQSIPYPSPQDYRASLPLMNGVIRDNAGVLHFNGGEANQANFTLDGFNISDPVTGRLETRLNIDSIQTVEVENSRFSAENGRGSAGVLDLKTKMGDDRWRFGGTNFVPGIASDGGFHLNKWTPRLEVSGPLAKGRAWFYNGFDAFYSYDLIHGLPHGQNHTSGLTTSDLSRFQINLTAANILTGSFLFNLADTDRMGLSIVNPAEATTNHRQTLDMSTLRDQHYFLSGALLDVGFADTRAAVRDIPQGDQLYQITPFGNLGNYFVNVDRHSYRQQGIANLFLPTVHFHGTHEFKFGIDFEREAFHQATMRTAYQVLRADGSVARYVSFAGSPFQARKDAEGALYVQDHWNPREGLTIEAGVRAEWNEIVRDLEIAPRLSVAWAPKWLRDIKIAAGWGVYYDSISLGVVTRQQDQVSMSTFYLPGGSTLGPVPTAFQVNTHTLETPYYQATGVSVEHKLPHDFYLRSGYTHRAGNRGFTFVPLVPESGTAFYNGAEYLLANRRRDRYDALDITLRHTFAGQYEWFAGYVRSSARSNAAVDYSLENPIFAPQAHGPFAWDTPNRFHMWGWVPLPKHFLPAGLRFLTRNTSAAYLIEYRTGFPFNVVDEEGFLVGPPESSRFPDYFSANLYLERRFRAIHYLWAWRFGVDNLTNNGNPNAVNNVTGTPQFRTFGRGQARAFGVRLRFLGRK